jgi:hypothetical protein
MPGGPGRSLLVYSNHCDCIVLPERGRQTLSTGAVLAREKMANLKAWPPAGPEARWAARSGQKRRTEA